MRYEELKGPLEGWTYDEAGTIYTASGYRTTPRQIEFCMWMYTCMTTEAKRWMIRSDEHPGALHPLFETQDLKPPHARMTKSPLRTRSCNAEKAVLREEISDAPQ